jgi:hypothetical protein
MKRKIALVIALVLTILTLVVGMQVIEVVDANPFFMFKPIDPIPGTIPPTIIMFSPQNNTAYSSEEIAVSFNASKPQLGKCGSSIIDITYTLDNETVQAFTIWKQNPGGGVSASSDSGIPQFNTTFTLPSLSTGNHSLTVKAEGVVFAGGESGLDIFFMNSTSTTFFTVANQPTSQQSSPTSESMGSDYSLNSIFLTAIVSVIVILAVTSVSLVYFKRHNKEAH